MAEITVTDRDGGVHRVNAREGASLMETLRELEYGVAAICGGMCSCATCHVYVAEQFLDRLPAMQGDEKEILQERLHVAVPTPVGVVDEDERHAARACEADRLFHPGRSRAERLEQRVAVVVVEGVEDVHDQDGVAFPELEHVVLSPPRAPAAPRP